MDKYIHDDGSGLWHKLYGDYYLPCVTVPAQKPIGILRNHYENTKRYHILKRQVQQYGPILESSPQIHKNTNDRPPVSGERPSFIFYRWGELGAPMLFSSCFSRYIRASARSKTAWKLASVPGI